MNSVKNYLKGIAIGAGAILPGISSGVLCVVFGIYEKLLDSILNFFSDMKNNFKFLLPITLGVLCGVILFGNILQYLFYKFPNQTSFIFIGLILGSIPKLFKEVHTKYRFKLRNIIYLLLALFLGIVSVILEKNLPSNIMTNFDYFYLIVSGFIMSIGIIIPGVSSTIILMLLGVYPTYLSSVSTLYFPVLIPMGIGLIFGAIIIMKITKFLLEHFYVQTFYAIIGFTLGSIFVLYPGFSFDLSGLVSLLCLLCGFLI